jgi:Protein of unknown function (DUF2848)
VTSLDLAVAGATGEPQHLTVEVQQILLAGYTGRDRAKVLEHIHELEALGVAPPARVPAIYVVPSHLLTTGSAVAVRGEQTSGEAEFYLLVTSEGMLVGVGSDHTDRAHETIDVTESKAMCPKPISDTVWRYEDVRSHWDKLELRSWVTAAGERRLYQEGRLGALLDVDGLLRELTAAGHADLRGHIVFGGTLPTASGLVFGDRFEVELYDPALDRRLRCGYDVGRPVS